MSWTVKCTSTPIDPSIPFSILDLKAQAVRLPVSKGAQILLSELLTWSGERGYCWWSNNAIARDLKWSASSVWRRTAELQEAGLLASIPRPGRSNYWVPLAGPAKMARLNNELTPLADSRTPFLKEKEKLKRCTVPQPSTGTVQPPSPPEEHNVNAVEVDSKEIPPFQTPPVHESMEPSQQPIIPEPIQQEPTLTGHPKSDHKPPLTPEHLFLVEEIERVTGDTWSRGHFVNLVRQTDENTIYAALSVTREKMSLESGVRGGAYFTATLRGMMELAGLGDRSSRSSISQSVQPPHISTPSQTPPIPRRIPIEEPDPVDPESLKKGWRLSYKAGGVNSLLSWVRRCVPASLDVTTLWTDVRTALPGVEESFAVDRFLDTVVTRMKHTKKMMDVG